MGYVKDVVHRAGGAYVVARALEVTPSAVYRWMDQDRIPVYAADVLGVEPKGEFSNAGRPRLKRELKVQSSMTQRLIKWVTGV